MIKITNTESAKVFYTGTKVEVQEKSVLLFVQMNSTGLGNMAASIIPYASKGDAKKKNVAHVDLYFTKETSEDDGAGNMVPKTTEDYINIGETPFNTEGAEPSLALAENFWTKKLEDAGFEVSK